MERIRNRLFACSIAVLTLLSSMPLQTVTTAFAAEEAVQNRGDVNGDGTTDSADLEALTKLLGEHVETLFAEEQYASYDITGEGLIDVRDRYALSQYLSGAAEGFPTEYGVQLEENLTLALKDAVCYPGDQFKIPISFVDWNKDIAAYDIVIGYDTELTLDHVEFLSGEGQAVVAANSAKLTGLYNGQSLWRGDLAILTFSVNKKAEGNFAVRVDGANVFTSGYNYYTAVKPTASVHVSPLYEPVALKADAVGSKSAAFSWEMPFTDQEIVSYSIYRDGELLGETEETHYLDKNLKPDTEYVYTVSAKTANGVDTAPSDPLTVQTAGPKIASAAFPADEISNLNSDLEIKLEKSAPLASLKLTMTAQDGKVTENTVKLDGSAVDVVSYHWDVSKLKGGKYTVKATVTDVDGASDTAETAAIVHGAPPTAVTLNSYASSRSIMLTWSLAVEAEASGYNIYRLADDGKTWELVKKISGRSTVNYTDTNLKAGQKYTYAVTVVDSFGLESEKSNTVSAVPEEDDVAPEITLFKPASSARVSGKLTIEIQARDNNAVQKVACLISADEGVTWEVLCENEGASGKWSIDTAKYKDGVYQLKAMAYDEDSHESSGQNVVAMSFDNTVPEQVKNLRTVQLTATSVTLAWDDVSDEDFSHFIVDVSTSSTVNSHKVSQQLGLNLNNLVPETEYTVTVYAVDQSGNAGPVSEPLKFISTADTTAPVITGFYVSSEVFSPSKALEVTVYATDTAQITGVFLEYSQDQKTWKTLRGTNGSKFTIKSNGLNDGEVYLRAYATDTYGNKGNPDDAKVYTVTLDSVKPEAPEYLDGSADAVSVSLEWGKSPADDVSVYRIERSVGEGSGVYAVIATTVSLSYRDSNVKSDGIYNYRVAAIDKAGNIGEYSDILTVTCTPDEVKPQIVQCYLSAQGIVCDAHRTLQIQAYDNMAVKTVKANYRCKDTDEWKPLTVTEASANSTRSEVLVRAVLPDDVMQAESVTVQMIAEDEAGNQGTMEKTFKVDNHNAEIKNFAAKQVENQIHLTWNCADITGVSVFRVFRTVNSGQEYCLTSFRPEKAGSFEFDDKRIEESGKYVYRVVAVMNNGNEISVSLDPMEIQAVPKAVLEYTSAQLLGAEYIYDASKSVKASEITKVKLSFGDKTVMTADSAEKAVFKYKYAEAGTYEITLTVENASGFSSKLTGTVTVSKASEMAEVKASVRTTEGKAAAYAAVYLDVGTDHQEKYVTDENGNVTFTAKAGTHEIGAFGNGYLPATKTVTLIAGTSNEVNFSVAADQLVTASFEVTRMTLAQIKAANINVADPENCQMVAINVSLEYKSKEQPSDHVTIYYDRGTGLTYLPPTSTYRYVVRTVTPDIKTVVLMRIPTKTQFLKEFFKVDMIVMNNASSEFALTDCNVGLHLPSGLTLMEDAIGSNSQFVHIDRIDGNSEKTISWIVRGDRAGNYNFSANFTGTLQPFKEPVEIDFPSDKPIRVYGQEAAKVSVNIDPVIRRNRLYIEMLVENQSPIDLNNLSTEVGDIVATTLGESIGTPKVTPVQTRFTGKDRILRVIETSERINVLHPGEKFSVLYSVTNIANDYPMRLLKALSESLSYSSTSRNVSVNIQPVSWVDVNDPFYGIDFDPETDFLFLVRNMNRDEVEGASVILSKQENGKKVIVYNGTADERGRVIVPRCDADTSYMVEIQAEGYEDYRDALYYFPSSTSYRSDSFTLKGDYEDNDYSVTNAYLRKEGEGSVNVLRSPYTITRGGQIPFDITVYVRTKAAKFELRQDTRKIASVDAEGLSAKFEGLTPNDFYVGKGVFVRVYTETGDFFDTPLNINVVTPSKEAYQSMIDDIIAMTSKYDVNLTVEAPSVIAEWGGDLALTIPFPNLEDADNIPDMELEITPTSAKATIGIGAEKEFKIGKYAAISFSIGVEFEAEIDLDKNEASITGSVKAGVSGSASATLVQVLEPVPFYVSMEIGASLEASAGVSYTFKFDKPSDSGWSYKIEGEGAIEITPAVGLGVDGFIGLEAYGTAGLHISGVLSATNEKPHMERIWLEGEAGIRGELLDHEIFKLKIVSGSIQFYPTGSNRPALANGYGLYAADGKPVLEEASDPSFYRPFTAEEIKKAGAWNGKLGDGLTALQSEISGGSAPVIASDGTNVVLAWIVKDTARGLDNASYVVYSVYDAAAQTWSEPVSVDDNTNADTAPVLYAGADGIRIVYQESGKSYEADEHPTLDEYAKQLTFKTAKFDAASGKFADFRTLNVNEAGGFASAPAFAQAADGTTYLVWKTNANGLLFGTDSSNAIMYAAETEEGFGEPAALAENLPAIISLSCGTDANGAPICAYVTDADNSIADPSDRTLNVAALNGTTAVLATGVVAAPKFTAIPGKDASGLVWFQDGKLFASTDLKNAEEIFDGTEAGLTERYEIAGDKILFLHSVSDGAALFSVQYDAEAGNFTAPVVLESGEGIYYEHLAAAKLGDDTLYAMSRSTVEMTPDDIIRSTELTGGILKDTQDISIADVQFSRKQAAAGKALPITVTVRNDGTTAADKLTLKVLDASGKEIASADAEAALASGASEDVTFEPVLPADLAAAKYTVAVSAAEQDRTPDNNCAEIDLSLTDISIQTDIEYLGKSSLVSIFAQNDSNVPTRAYVHIKPNAAEEETLMLVSDEIAPHTSAFWQIDAKEMLGDIYHGFVTISAESDAQDCDSSNNSVVMVLTKTGFDPAASGDIDFDGAVTLKDARLALKGYTYQMVQLDDIGLTPTQQRAADFNHNGKIDLRETHTILKYYVYVFTEVFTGTMDEFLAQEAQEANKDGGAEA